MEKRLIKNSCEELRILSNLSNVENLSVPDHEQAYALGVLDTLRALGYEVMETMPKLTREAKIIRDNRRGYES